MIGEGPPALDILPPVIDAALKQHLAGATPVLALNGSPGEALAATADALFLMRAGQRGVAVHRYALADVRDLVVEDLPTGVRLRVVGAPRVSADLESDSVFFPAAAKPRLQMAVGRLRRNLGGAAAGGGAESVSETCAKCGGRVPTDGAFCPSCGEQQRAVCGQCGRTLERDWRACPGCGAATDVAAQVSCPQCQSRVDRHWLFCVQCGLLLTAACNRCGTPMRSLWRHCPACGLPAGATPVPMSGGGSPVAAVAPEQAAEAERLNDQGAQAFEAEQYDRAIDLFFQAVNANPYHSPYYVNLAVALDEAKRTEEAISAYQGALQLNPGETLALLNLGYLERDRGNVQQARQLWEALVAQSPDSEDAEEARSALAELGG
jgi:RNA polymerase subunit RPABC4/transcription elongation factor Spt4